VNGQLSLFTPRPRREATPAAPQQRNLVIEAGAGTGKTTAIVAEVLKLLLSSEELAPERIVLMTFTEKAAGEIADRIHEALTAIANGAESWPPASSNPLIPAIDANRRAACVKQLARIDALRSQTIHSFCQMLLRQFPLEAALDPQFTIVEGFERSRLYGELYDAWVDDETRVHPTDEARRDWEVLIEHAGYLFMIRALVFELLDRRDLLMDESYDIGSIAMIEPQLADAVATIRALAPKTPIGRYFLANLPPHGDLEAWIEYLRPMDGEIRELDLRGQRSDAMSAAIRYLRGSDKKGDSVVDRLTSHRAAIALLAMTRRFIRYLDAEKRRRGVVDFDDLLLRTLSLLDDGAVLERVRRQFDCVFVDEFQDTDRVQAKIIERLAPPRLVLVGDPKQSIYGFRRADPETYNVFTRTLLDAGAEHRFLDEQYRSEPPLLDAINALFAKIFDALPPDPNVFSPPYHPLKCGRRLQPADGPAEAGLHTSPPFVVLTAPTEDKHIAEAEAIAAWIAENGDGDLRRFTILLRRMTKLDDYLDVFDRHGIAYVLPPTRLFLDRPAAVDLVAVLRAIAYPFDRGAEASAARSPYFALTDLEIVRGMDGLKPVLHSLREASRHRTVSQTIDLVLETCGIERVYAAAADRDRSLRHLEHLRAIAFQFDQTVGGSLRQFVDEIARRRGGEPDEMEPSLLDDASNSVRILTVHAAKGLEFDTVILPDLEFPLKPQELYTVEEPRLLVMSGQVSTLSTVAAKEIGKQREEAENRRLFYVAVTRAKSQVVFVTNEKATNSGFSKYVKEFVGIDVNRVDGLKPVLHRTRRKLADPELEARLAAAPILPLELPQCTTGFSPSLPSAARPTRRNRAAGILLHRFLERWDGRGAPDALLAALAHEQGCDDETLALVRRRAMTVAKSDTFRRIAAAEIVGRELPIAFLDERGDVVQRRLDRLIRIGGEDVVVDYKSGEPDEARLARDRAQVEEYCRAVARATGRPCRGMLWYIDAEADRAFDV
jgi:ATP-dependent helicase/nuclease subunit A